MSKKKFDEDSIRVAAYYIWEQAGRPEGADKECWIKACEQLFAPKPKAKKETAKKEEKPAAVKTLVTKVTRVSEKPAMKKPAAGAAPFYGARK